MSRIYFHSPSGTAELRGSERAHMGLTCAALTAAMFRPGKDVWSKRPALLSLILPGYDERMFDIYLSSGNRDFEVDGAKYDAFSVTLNTALAIGGDPLRLMARLHGQSELHGWVAGPNREWVAAIIDEGRASGLMRAGQGWEKVAAFLRTSDSEPVVTSYSVCDRFPNAGVAGWKDANGGDDWYVLPHAEQWDRAFAGIQGTGLEFRPDAWVWPDFSFMHGQTAMSLLDAAAALLAPSTESEG
jgi:hypothetical protein